jgi:transposase
LLWHDDRCAAAADLSECDGRVRITQAAAGQRPAQGRRDRGAAAPDHGPAAAVRHDPAAVLPRRPGVPGRPAAPAPRDLLGQIHLLVRPDTVLRWHRDLLARRHAARSRPRRPGRPRTIRSVRLLVLLLARENGWGYRRIHGELLVLGVKVAASTVWEILKQAGIDPAPDRASTTWASFLRSQADALLACDFFETGTLDGTRQFVLAVIEHAPAGSGSWAQPRIRLHPGSSKRPGTSSWTWRTPAAGRGS